MNSIQVKFLDYFEKLLRKSGMSNETISFGLRGIHILLGFTLYYCIIFGNKKTFKKAIIAMVFVFSIFFIFNGCILTRLERRFSQDDFIVIDPLIKFCNLSCDHNTRFRFTIYFNLLTLFLSGIIYYFRFIYKWNHQEEIKTI